MASPALGLHLDERDARPLGRRPHPHRLPRHPLRVGRLRGHPLLQDPEGLGRLPARRAHRAAVQLRQDLLDGASPSRPRRSNAAILETITRQPARRLLHPARGLPGRRAARGEPPRQPGRGGGHGLGLGQVPGQGSARGRRRRLRQLLDPDGPEHPARHGQERGQLPQLPAHQGRGGQGRLRGGHRARRRRLRLRGQRREPLRGREGPPRHPAPGLLGAARASRATP